MTQIARLATWLARGTAAPKCAYCGSTEPTPTSVRDGRDWFCSTDHADEQRLFWSAI